MKNNKLLILILGIFVLAISCKEAPTRPGALLDENFEPIANPTSATTANNSHSQEPSQNEQGTWHYTCPTGCSGGAGSAQPCPKCGTTLAHNPTYHNDTKKNYNASQNSNSPTLTKVDAPPGTPGSAPGAQSVEPALNDKGVWHFTCPNNCSGGAGGALACGQCGTTLVHNAEYHK